MKLFVLLGLLSTTAVLAKPLNLRGDSGGDGDYPTATTTATSPPTATATATPGPSCPGTGGGDNGGGDNGGGDDGGDGSYVACTPGALYSNAQCCATDVGGIADLDCANPSAIPSSPDDFKGLCADVGKTARCCVIPVLGQDVLCTTPQGL